MIRSVTVINPSGRELTMVLNNPWESGLAVLEVSGLGPPKATINSSKVVGRDGTIVNSTRVDSRNIVFNLKFMPNKTIQESRRRTYEFFPIKKSVELRFNTDEESYFTYGYVESNEASVFSAETGTTISVICEDPYFYLGGKEDSQITQFTTVIPMFEFPFSNESLEEKLLIFGNQLTVPDKTLFYQGTTPTGFVARMVFSGSVVNPALYNVLTAERIKIDTTKLASLTGSGIKEGDEIIISTVRGAKKIQLFRDGLYKNILNTADKNMVWLELQPGDNVLTYTADLGAANMSVEIRNRVLLEGF